MTFMSCVNLVRFLWKYHFISLSVAVWSFFLTGGVRSGNLFVSFMCTPRAAVLCWSKSWFHFAAGPSTGLRQEWGPCAVSSSLFLFWTFGSTALHSQGWLCCAYFFVWKLWVPLPDLILLGPEASAISQSRSPGRDFSSAPQALWPVFLFFRAIASVFDLMLLLLDQALVLFFVTPFSPVCSFSSLSFFLVSPWISVSLASRLPPRQCRIKLCFPAVSLHDLLIWSWVWINSCSVNCCRWSPVCFLSCRIKISRVFGLNCSDFLNTSIRCSVKYLWGNKLFSELISVVDLARGLVSTILCFRCCS
jgi:hypothetical protein